MDAQAGLRGRDALGQELRAELCQEPVSRSRVTVTLSDPRHGHFGKMTLRYTYQGRAVVDTRCNYTGFTYWVLPPLLGGHGCPGPGGT